MDWKWLTYKSHLYVILTIYHHIDRVVHIISYAIACLTTICGSIIGSVLGKFKLFTSKLLEVNWSFSFKKPNSNKLLLPLHETDNNSYQLYHAAWPGRKQTASAYCVVQNTFPYTHLQAESFGQPWGQKNQWCSSSTKLSFSQIYCLAWLWLLSSESFLLWLRDHISVNMESPFLCKVASSC